MRFLFPADIMVDFSSPDASAASKVKLSLCPMLMPESLTSLLAARPSIF